MPDWFIGDAIFPLERQINTSEAVRKTTEPLAKKIWSRELPESLRSDLHGKVKAET